MLRVGSSPFSANRSSISALWHDVDYIPEKRFETPVVTKMLQDFALPHEEHQLPEGVADPFQKLDLAFELAAEQEKLGRQGQTFLHGKPRAPLEATDPRRHADDAARVVAQGPVRGSALDHKVIASVRADLDQLRRAGSAASTPIAVGKGATKTAAQAEADASAGHIAGTGDVLSSAAVFVPLAAGQAVQGLAQGPLPALATQATSVANAVVSAGEVATVGIADGLKGEAPLLLPRRGLSRTQIG